MPNYRVTAIFGRNRIEVQDEKGNKSVRRATHVKVCHPVDKVIDQLAPQTVYEQYGRTSKLLKHPKDILYIPLQLFEERRQTTEEGEKDINMLEMNDTPDESNSRTQTCTATEKLCDSEIFTLDSEEEVLVPVDKYDELKNRELCPRRKEQCQINISVTSGVPTVISICDASRNRSQATKLQQKPPTTDVSASVGKDDVDIDINSNDELKTRTYKTTVICSNEPFTQHSIQASNQWLFSAFSKFTSNVLGKGKNALREEFAENINTKCTNPAFKPEFNFFL